MTRMDASTLPTPGALDGVRVLDLSRVLAGPWCTQTLADLGADVIKVERPPADGQRGGDDTRGWGPPFLADDEGRDTDDAAYFLGANRNKRSVTIDLAQPAGQALVKRLAAQADVLVENFKVGDMARYGLDAESLRREFPRLVYCSITGFGQTGPYRERAGYDYAIQGLGGLMSVTGERDDKPGGGPQKVGVAVADLFTGLGQVVDMALLDSQVAMLANLGANYLVTHQPPRRAGNAHQNIVPYQVFEVADGHLILAVGNDGQFDRFCRAAGCESLAGDERFATNAARVRHREALVALLQPVLLTRPRDAWLAALEAAKVPAGPINDLGQVFADPQVRSRGMVAQVAHPRRRSLELVASPIKLSATPAQVRRPPPLLGEHTDAVLEELGVGAAERARLRAQGVIGPA
jgi:crotonobetainyl-CoA:carnitine CoA-transferase CaiB-like acyl-CoA transferase